MSKLTRTAALALALLVAPGLAQAAGSIGLLSAHVDLDDRSSLQRGAKYFVNYCSGCHSLNYMRYKRMGEDLGISDDLMRENLLFGDTTIEAPMSIAMKLEDAEVWFGVAPPDLSVVARSRGPDWLYSYLVTFFDDPSPARPFGVNNVVFTDVGMPHVLWSLQGRQVLERAERPANVVSEHGGHLEVAGDSIRIHHRAETADGDHVELVDRLEVIEPGELSAGEYRKVANDIAGFLTYVGEPAKLVRYKIGFWVLAFLAVFFLMTRALYKEYWRDVH